MVSKLAKTSLPDANAVDSFCSRQNLNRETFFLAAWAHTLSVYSASSTITTHVVRRSQGDVHASLLLPVSATIEGHTTVLEVFSALQTTDDVDHSPHTDADQPFGPSAHGTDLHNGGTAIRIIARDEVGGHGCEVGGAIQAVLAVDDLGHVTLDYMPDSVPALSAEAFLETFVTIAQELATRPHDTLLSELDILGPVNRATLETWSPADLSAVERCIHEYVDEHARNHPQKQAVASSEGPDFTYAQLSALSDNLAACLLELGIKKGQMVPILFEKSSLAVLAVVAILKAGGAYVGFSAETPLSFLKECSCIADVPLIITSPQHKQLAESIGRPLLVLDDDLVEKLENPASIVDFSSPAVPSDLAYLVFTSGSTGVPKAVMIEHRAYVTDALAQQQSALLDETSRVLHFASYNFDATNFDILSTLIAGATICVPSEFDRINRLAGAINDLGATFLGVTATLAQTLDPDDVPRLSVVVLCGEANSPEIVQKWTRTTPGAGPRDVLNGYGPSEASCAFALNVYTRQSPRANNVGRALDGACWGWVVNPDNHGQLLPVGAKGELLIQGPTLSRGYLNEPEKTAKAFIESPAWLPAKTAPRLRRLYKTGDLVRQLPDQSFEVYGRIDTQVKLNGQRIELGDIEHKISQVLGDNLIIAVEALRLSLHEQGESKVLVAFYAPTIGSHQRDISMPQVIDRGESAAIDVRDAKTKLAGLLKAIAIPRAFVPLRFMPVTIQGKLDRRFLQALGKHLDKTTMAAFSGVVPSQGGDPVRTESERAVQSLFSQSLNLGSESIFRDSDFFALGGDSVKAIKTVSLARKLGFSLVVPDRDDDAQDILQTPKLSHLAKLIERSKATREAVCEYRPFDAIMNQTAGNEIREKAAQCVSGYEDVEDVIHATDLQASCVAFSTYKEERRGINWLLCDFKTPHDEETVRQMCEHLTARHATLRTSFMAHGRTLYQVASKSFQPPIRTHLHLGSITEATDSLMEDDLQRRVVDMARPQTAFELLSHGDATRIERLVIRISAAQYDGQSVVILGREMNFLLDNLKHGHTGLRELKGSYAAYLHHARTVELEQGVEYWRSLLAGAEMPEIAKRRTSDPGNGAPSNLQFVDGVLVSMIETRLLDLAATNGGNAASTGPLAGSTRATIVKTAWALTLAELTGRDDVVFASTGWGRNNAVEFAQDVMGSCTSHIPTRAQLKTSAGSSSGSGSDRRLTYGELVEQLQAQHIASMRFENIGATAIVEKCTPWQRWTRFSSLLIFQGLDIEKTPSQQRGGGGRDGEEEEDDDEGHLRHAAAPAVKITEIMDPGDRADVILHVEPFGDQTRVMMAFAKRNVPEKVAGEMLQAFKRHLELATSCANQPVDIGDRGAPPLLPVVCDGAADMQEVEEPSVGGESGELAAAAAIVKETWTNVLDISASEVDRLMVEKKSFFEVWGSPVAAAALAHEYKKKGLSVSTENVLRSQTVQEQVGLISSVV
ncbi:Nonribosomal peptide synthetase 12 [Colletotrichum tanaceti]|nr:Nonribosomal peptide synthetase 12 [Colletotrichum tanaceti]